MTVKQLPGRSEGSQRLARLALPQEAIATRLGVDRSLVSLWLSGARRPGAGNRAAFRQVYGIPDAAWGRPIVAAEPPPDAKSEPNGNGHANGNGRGRTSSAVRDEAEGLAAQVRILRDRIMCDKTATPSEQAKVFASAAATLNLLGKLTGETLDLGESRILRLPAWRRIEETIERALDPWPEAMRAVADALHKLGG